MFLQGGCVQSRYKKQLDLKCSAILKKVLTNTPTHVHIKDTRGENRQARD